MLGCLLPCDRREGKSNSLKLVLVPLTVNHAPSLTNGGCCHFAEPSLRALDVVRFPLAPARCSAACCYLGTAYSRSIPSRLAGITLKRSGKNTWRREASRTGSHRPNSQPSTAWKRETRSTPRSATAAGGAAAGTTRP